MFFTLNIFEGLSPFIRTYNYDNNLRVTFIVNECIKTNVRRLVFTSTLGVRSSRWKYV